MEVDVVTLASEYPNDNPALHGGVRWVCRKPVGAAQPVYPEPERILASHASLPSIPPPEASGVLPTMPIAPATASLDPFAVFVRRLADIAIGAGAPHVAAILPGLLEEGRLDGVDEDLARTLRARGVGEGAEVSASFRAVTAAWRAILRGTIEDFDACRGTMLDEWASDLLSALLATKAKNLRSELRARGIAAFGIVDVAA